MLACLPPGVDARDSVSAWAEGTSSGLPSAAGWGLPHGVFVNFVRAWHFAAYLHDLFQSSKLQAAQRLLNSPLAKRSATHAIEACSLQLR